MSVRKTTPSFAAKSSIEGMSLSHCANYGIIWSSWERSVSACSLAVYFSTQFLQTLGNLTTTETILLKVPGSVASTIFPLASGLIARRTQQPMYTGILMCVISLAGCIVLACVPSGAVKLVGCYLNWGMTELWPCLMQPLEATCLDTPRKFSTMDLW